MSWTKNIKQLTKKDWSNIAIISSIIVFILAIVVIGLTSFIYRLNLESDIELEYTKGINSANLIEKSIQEYVGDVKEDLFVLRDSNELSDYLTQSDAESSYELEQLLYRFFLNKDLIYRIHVLDEFGYEVAAVVSIDDQPRIVEEKYFQDMSQSNFFLNSIELEDREFFISNFNLNSEYDQSTQSFLYTITYSTPLYKNDVLEGVLVIDVIGDNLYNTIVQQNRVGMNDTLMMVDEEGYYIINNDEEKLFGFAIESRKDAKLSKDFPDISSKILDDTTGYFLDDDNLYAYVSITPFIEAGAAYSNVQWQLIDIIPKDDFPVSAGIIVFGMTFLNFLVLFSSMIVVTIVIIVLYSRRKDIDQLKITQKIADETNDTVIISDTNNLISYVNKAFLLNTGYDEKDLLGKSTRVLQSGIYDKNYYIKMWDIIHATGSWSGVIWDKKRDGTFFLKKLTITSMNRFASKNKNYISISANVTHHIGYHKNDHFFKQNPENSWSNNSVLLSGIKKDIKNNNSSLFAVLCIKILNYNDFYIQLESDREEVMNLIIKQIESKLKNNKVFIAILSKTIFTLGIKNLKNKTEVENIVKDILNKHIYLVRLKGHDIFIDASIGVAIHSSTNQPIESMIDNAFMTMDYAIRTTNKKYEFYSDAIVDYIQKEVEINTQLKSAVFDDELSILYQAQVDFEHKKVVGYEALVRWNNPKIGFVSPELFINIAEKSGQIIELGYWIIERVFKDISALNLNFLHGKKISINISPVQFNDNDIVSVFISLSKKYNVPLSYFKIEITENVFVKNIQLVIKKLEQFLAIGIESSIDDFGTGYSSLQYLQKLNVSELKIDKSFIDDVTPSSVSQVTIGITNLAKELSLNTICEGAETLFQVQYLSSIGCHHIQGYYFSKPIPVTDLVHFEEILLPPLFPCYSKIDN